MISQTPHVPWRSREGNEVTANEPQRYNPNEEATYPEQKNDFPSQERVELFRLLVKAEK